MFDETRRWQSPGGADLAWHHQEATAEAHGILLISHGLAEHARRYRPFAEYMAAKGYHVYAHDHRGHGETRAADAPLGRFAQHDGTRRVLEDVFTIRDMAAKRHPALPVILFGHSMGGLIALNAAFEDPGRFDALAVWNSNFHPGPAGRAAQAILFMERWFKGSDVPSQILPRLTFEAWGRSIAGAKTPFDWLSHDEAEVARYIDDPLCGFACSVSLWIDVFSLTFSGPKRALSATGARDLPIHLAGGGQDPATFRGRSVFDLANHLKKTGFSNISTRIYEEMRHETLNEIDRNTAMAEFAAWCGSVSGGFAAKTGRL